MKQLKAIVCDLDGTLLNEDSKIGIRDIETLKELRSRGIKIIIATGRSIFSFKKAVQDSIPVDYLIFDAGAGIMDVMTEKLLFSSFMTRDQVIDIAGRLWHLKLDFQIRNRIPDSHLYYYKKFGRYNPDFDRINEVYKVYNRELTDIEDLNESSRIISISPDIDSVDIIEKEFPEFSIIRATSPVDKTSVWMEIYPKGINKGNALKYLCTLVDIDLTETIGFGNDYNDIHFLDIVGTSYMVSNAPEELKAKYIETASSNHNPISFVFERRII
jgi:Cof subfamily protein (haloacid dehalogenase superfamily)